MSYTPSSSACGVGGIKSKVPKTEESKPKKVWVIVIIVLIIIISVITFLVKKWAEEVAKLPYDVYSENKVLKEHKFSLKPGEKATVHTFDPETNTFFVYTWVCHKSTESSSLTSWACGEFGADGDDRINGFHRFQPFLGENIIYGGYPNSDIHYVHVKNMTPVAEDATGSDETVEFTIKLWGREKTTIYPAQEQDKAL